MPKVKTFTDYKPEYVCTFHKNLLRFNQKLRRDPIRDCIIENDRFCRLDEFIILLDAADTQGFEFKPSSCFRGIVIPERKGILHNPLSVITTGKGKTGNWSIVGEFFCSILISRGINPHHIYAGMRLLKIFSSDEEFSGNSAAITSVLSSIHPDSKTKTSFNCRTPPNVLDLYFLVETFKRYELDTTLNFDDIVFNLLNKVRKKPETINIVSLLKRRNSYYRCFKDR